MKILSVTSPALCADGASISCVAQFDNGEAPALFIASPNDCTEHGRDIHTRAKAGAFGVVQKYVAQPDSVPSTISALQGLLAVEKGGLAAPYTAWAASPSRTFSERAFIDKAVTWDRNDKTLLAAATAFGLTSAQVDGLFKLGATL